MIPPKLVSLSLFLIVLGGVLWPRVAPTQGPSKRRQEATPLGVPWGVTLETDRPFYRVGDAADVLYTVSNSSGRDAAGWTLVRGGNGCMYRITIVDPMGQTVWQPGSIINGQFIGPGCLFAQTAVELPDRTWVQGGVPVPLIYQNPGGIGVLGQPLPPDYYQVCIRVYFSGPNEQPFVLPGLDFTACVPIRIDP